MKTELLFDGDFLDAVIKNLKKAEFRVWVVSYSWRWYLNAPEKKIQKFNTEICRAALRGVDVRIVTDQKTQSDVLQSYGLKAKCTPIDQILHAKGIMIDDESLFVGSHNLTERANGSNRELSIVTDDFECIMQFQKYFETMWKYL